MRRYKKKPVIIEAVQFKEGNLKTVFEFVEDNDILGVYKGSNNKLYANIHTLEGSMRVSEGDYIIKGVQGEFYPCKPDIFKQTYEEVE